MEDAIVELRNIYKSYSGRLILENINLSFKAGKINTILGPSGAGKTTLLKIIAGLEEPDRGSVYIKGVEVTNKPPWKRGVSMVFQEPALLPHLNVYENIAFGLEVLELKREEINERVRRAASLLKIEHLLDKYPEQLSGGEAKRVSLARALVVGADILLLDEPFSNLDLALREDLRRELYIIQRKLGITIIHVTHDHDEALEISDYISILHNGKVIDHGETLRVYEKPKNRAAAKFWKHNVVNCKSGIVELLQLPTCSEGYYVLPPHYLGVASGDECYLEKILIRRNHALLVVECMGESIIVSTTIIQARDYSEGVRIGLTLLVDKDEIAFIHG